MTSKIRNPTLNTSPQSLRSSLKDRKNKATKVQMLCPVPPKQPARSPPSSDSHMEHKDLRYTLLDWPESTLMVKHKL